ncbi:hypothetical protein Oter_0514 [Opitutus terrae PB90-1]|uniref:Uncharacterized protein n=1 Tax=Opitutus terrae (strain DSM 11246 / JCM 15787 / PB90-1) TaxID=452637 RepID=B1ZRW1_OPITP|nr:hypothetical protein Oter_0514 [Opitutus terrae PB90-1]
MVSLTARPKPAERRGRETPRYTAGREYAAICNFSGRAGFFGA